MERVELREICNLKSGSTPRRSNKEYWSNGNIPWAKISDLETSTDGYVYDTEEHISEKGLKSINNRFFEKGTLLFAMYGSVGKTAIAAIDLTMNQAILGINIKNEAQLSLKYLRYYLSVEKDRLLNRAVGATLKNLSKTIVGDLKIPLPDIPTQKAIAARLDQAEAVKNYNQELLAKYDQLGQAIFLELFGDPVKNEKGWNLKKGEDFVKVYGGGVFKSKDYTEYGIPLIRIGAVNKGYFDKESIVFVPESFKESHHKYLLYPGDMLLTLTGTVGKDDYGNIFVLGNDFSEYFLNQRVAKLNFNEKIINPVYFRFILKFDGIKKQLTNISRGVRQANISNNDIYALNIPAPPLNLQTAFVRRIENIERQKAVLRQEIEKSEELFNSLLQESFRVEEEAGANTL